MKASLHIQTALHQEKTILKKAYYTTPFKIADITEDKSQKALQLMLMTSSPGVLDGDELNIRIEIGENSSLELQTQSYQRLFTMKKGAAQNMEVCLEKDASFSYLPHPVVPHKAANFVAKNKIYLSHGACLTWGEVLTCGRKLSGEAFTFTKYHNMTEVYLNNKLAVKENLLVEPAQTELSATGQWEGYTHQSSFLYISETAPVNILIAELHNLLSNEEVCFGVSALPVNGVIVRMLGYKGEQLYNLHKKIEYIARSTKAIAGNALK